MGAVFLLFVTVISVPAFGNDEEDDSAKTPKCEQNLAYDQTQPVIRLVNPESKHNFNILKLEEDIAQPVSPQDFHSLVDRIIGAMAEANGLQIRVLSADRDMYLNDGTKRVLPRGTRILVDPETKLVTAFAPGTRKSH